jgi:hypothetical protein
MRFFFISTEFFWLLLGLIIYSSLKFSLFIQIPLLLIALLILFILRKSSVSYRDTFKSAGEIYLSPIHGTVESIRHLVTVQDLPFPCHEIRISLSFWNQKGLYLPTASELLFLKTNKGKKQNRKLTADILDGSFEDVSYTHLTFISKNQSHAIMRFVDCTTGLKPRVWLKSGDRGRAGACFGYYPFGGTLLIYLPATSDILIYEKEIMIPGQTVIAALKDQPKV